MENNTNHEQVMAILKLDIPNHDKVILIAIAESGLINDRKLMTKLRTITGDCRGTLSQITHRLYNTGYLSWSGPQHAPDRKLEWEKIMGTTKGE